MKKILKKINLGAKLRRRAVPKTKKAGKKVIKKSPINPIAVLIDRYYQTQEHRLAMGNQIFQLEAAKKGAEPFKSYFNRFHAIEKDMAKYMESEIENHPMYDWFMGVKGIGPIFAAGLIAVIDIKKADHASSIWKYAGLAPGQKRVKGQKLDYNPDLKTLAWKIGESFVKSKGEYRKIYDTSRQFYDKKFPKKVLIGDKKDKNGKIIKLYKYTDGHKYAMAKRRTVKIFLANMWAEWRKLANLPVSEPFAHRGLPKYTRPPDAKIINSNKRAVR